MTIRIQYFFPQTCFFLFFFITQNKRTLSAIRQRTLTVRCSPYLFTVHVYTHKKIVHHHYYISSLHPPPSWIRRSECLKTIIFKDSTCIQCSLALTHTHTHTHTHTRKHTQLSPSHTHTGTTQRDLCSVDSHQRGGTALALHSRGFSSFVKPTPFWQCQHCILMC